MVLFLLWWKEKNYLAGCRLLRRKLSLFYETNYISTFILLSDLTTSWLLFCGSSSFGFVFVICPNLLVLCDGVHFSGCHKHCSVVCDHLHYKPWVGALLKAVERLGVGRLFFSPHLWCYYQTRNAFCLSLACAIYKSKEILKSSLFHYFCAVKTAG